MILLQIPQGLQRYDPNDMVQTYSVVNICMNCKGGRGYKILDGVSCNYFN
jgi:hypothetical protein